MVDSTNPRVMADNIKMLAAAGGGGASISIFVDPTNVIVNQSSTETTDTYTATVDSFVMADVVTTANEVATVKLNDVVIFEMLGTSGNSIHSFNTYLKAGQTIKVEQSGTLTHSFKVFGLLD